MGIDARENRRSMTPMPDTNHRAPITTHGYRCAGKPAIHDAHAEHGPDESARSLCGVPVMPDESDSPLCGVPVGVSRVLCQNESRSMPVVPASPVHGRVPVDARRAGRVPCGNESRSMPVSSQAPAQHTPVADAANRCVANIFSLVRRGVPSGHVQRRG